MCFVLGIIVLVFLFFFFFLEGVTMTAKQNNLTLTVIVYLLNTRHILLLSQPSDVCYA